MTVTNTTSVGDLLKTLLSLYLFILDLNFETTSQCFTAIKQIADRTVLVFKKKKRKKETHTTIVIDNI